MRGSFQVTRRISVILFANLVEKLLGILQRGNNLSSSCLEGLSPHFVIFWSSLSRCLKAHSFLGLGVELIWLSPLAPGCVYNCSIA